VTAPAHAELGETKDPVKLVPGNPSSLLAAADSFRSEATRIDDLRGVLSRVRTPSWSGDAAYGWEDAQAAELDKWKAYLGVLEACQKAVRTYADALSTAQASAQTAIDLWADGEAKTKSAKTVYDAAVDRWAQDMLDPPTDGTAPEENPGSFDDPGEALRDEAKETLDKARKKLDEAGETAMVTLGKLDGAKTTGSDDFKYADGSVKGPKISWGSWNDTFGKNPLKGKSGKYDSGQDESPFKIDLGSISGQAGIYKAQGTYEDYYGDVKVNAEGSVTAGELKGELGAGIDKNGAHVNAEATATVVGAEGKASGEYGVLKGEVAANAAVLATAKGDATIGLTGAHAEGEVFAGAKAGGSASGSVAGVGLEGTAEGWAGIGASGHVDVGYDDGKITLGGSGGIAFGIGGKLGGNVTVDVGGVIDAAEDVTEFAGDVADTVGDLVPDIDVTPW
jgi:uncharacterized protein YukE